MYACWCPASRCRMGQNGKEATEQPWGRLVLMCRSPRWCSQLSPGWAWHTGNLETTVWPNQDAWNCLRGRVDGSNLRLGQEGCRVQAAHDQSQWSNPWLPAVDLHLLKAWYRPVTLCQVSGKNVQAQKQLSHTSAASGKLRRPRPYHDSITATPLYFSKEKVIRRGK